MEKRQFPDSHHIQPIRPEVARDVPYDSPHDVVLCVHYGHWIDGKQSKDRRHRNPQISILVRYVHDVSVFEVDVNGVPYPIVIAVVEVLVSETLDRPLSIRPFH